ncbi:hypothetical protein [Methyloglobulus sp.]
MLVKNAMPVELCAISDFSLLFGQFGVNPNLFSSIRQSGIVVHW